MRVSAWVRQMVRQQPGRNLGIGLIAGLAAGASGAWAQQAPEQPAADNGLQLQEVVVTAERRSENIQNVPIAVSAFTADQLASRNLQNVQALSSLSPGVNLDAGSAPFSGDRSVLSASIRGVGQDDFAFNMNPAVGVYVDGVYLARTIGANQNLLDVDRVEILKGPQGTLFGSNTEGGAISITTHNPGNEFKVTAQVTGGSYDRRDVGFTADIPIIKDTLLSTITVATQDRNGWVKVLPDPNAVDASGQVAPFVTDPNNAYPKSTYQTSDNFGGYNVQTIRGKIVWNATDKDTVTFGADWNHQDQTAMPYTTLATYVGNLGTGTFGTLYDTCISNSAATINDAVAAGLGAPPTWRNIPGLAQVVGSFAAYCARPRSQVPGLSTGGAPLLGAGYVGTPYPWMVSSGLVQANLQSGSAGYAGSAQPRLFYDNYTAGIPTTANGVPTGLPDLDSTYGSGQDLARNDYFGFSITAQHEFNDSLSLKSISAYRQISWLTGTDLDGVPETIQEVSDHQHQWQVSQEFQFNGKAFNDALNYVAGLYYFEEAGYVHDYVPFSSILYVYDFANDVNTKNEAAYFHADYKWNNWGFTAGGRYTDVQEEFIGGQGDLNGFSPGCTVGSANGYGPVGTCVAVSPANVTAAYAPYIVPGSSFIQAGQPIGYFPGNAANNYANGDTTDHSQSWKVFDPTLGLQYHFTNDVMAYASWGKGFKAGGWTTRLSSLGVAYGDTTYQPETTKTWELGLKSSWFNRRLQADGALFYTDYNNIQLNIQRGISPVYTNAGNAKIKGAELELKGVVGGGLTLNVGASYIDAYYTAVNANANIPQTILPTGDTVCPAGPPICTDTMAGVLNTSAKLPKTPKYKVSFYPEYDWFLANQSSIRLIADYTLTASMYNDSLNTPELWRHATHMLNAAVHYVTASDQYDLAVGATNLTDDRYVMGGSPNNGAGEVGGYFNEPREWYVQLTAKFK